MKRNSQTTLAVSVAAVSLGRVALSRLVWFGVAILAASQASAKTHCEVDKVALASRFADEAAYTELVVASHGELANVDWDAQRLAQAADRLPKVLASSADAFAVDRKFLRISELFLSVRDGAQEALESDSLPDVEEALNTLESRFVELAIALKGDQQ